MIKLCHRRTSLSVEPDEHQKPPRRNNVENVHNMTKDRLKSDQKRENVGLYEDESNKMRTGKKMIKYKLNKGLKEEVKKEPNRFKLPRFKN